MRGQGRPIAGRHGVTPRWRARYAVLSMLGCLALLSLPVARAQQPATLVLAAAQPGEPLDAAAWIARMRQAAIERNYSGTFVVLAAHGGMSSARVWHACDGQSQIERVEALSGTPRIVFRRDSEVRTFLPQERIVRSEMQRAPGTFPALPQASGVLPKRHYQVQMGGQERVAGLDAEVLSFVPRDAWRYGHRVWIDRASGLLVKMQTIDGEGRVLEQAAFSELTMGVPLGLQSMGRMMDDVAGYRLVTVATQPTSAQAEGWSMAENLAGFASQGCYNRRSLAPAEPAQPVLQCIYSDGLASLSVFLEPYDVRRHPLAPQALHLGATQVLAQKVGGETWVTAVGEVPERTLRQFMQALRHGR